jgi:hypothetical protein
MSSFDNLENGATGHPAEAIPGRMRRALGDGRQDGTFANTLLVAERSSRFGGNAVPTLDLVRLVRFLRTFLQAQIASPGTYGAYGARFPRNTCQARLYDDCHLGRLTTGEQGNRGRAEMFRTFFRDYEIGSPRERDHLCRKQDGQINN